MGDFWFNVFNDAGGVLANVGPAVLDAIRTFCFWLDTTVYKLIIYIYNWFLMLCNGRILDSEVIGQVTNKVSIILGTFMLFYVAIGVLQMVLDPDKMSDKEAGVGSIIKKVILVVVMLGLSSNVFDMLYDVQKILLGNNQSGTNVIQNLLLPYKVDSDRFGEELSYQLLNSFYHVNDNLEIVALNSNSSEQSVFVNCANYQVYLGNNIRDAQDFSLGYNCLNQKTSVTGQTDYVMYFESIISVAVGIFVVYMLFMYCIKVGVRIFQLAFLEILAPAAIIGYLSPKKDNIFDKWKNVYISTYIDVFVRVAIINLVVYMISVILDGLNSGTGEFMESLGLSSATSNKFTYIFIPVIMILALLTFAKRAPELLKAILPQGGAGSIGYGIGKKDNEFGFGLLSGAAAKGAGVLGGAVGGLVGGVAAGSIGGAAFGLLRGGLGGLKNKKIGDTLKSASGGYKAQRDASKKMADIRANGGNFWGYKKSQLQAALGRRTAYDDMQLSYSKMEQYTGAWSKAKSTADGEVDKHLSNYSVKIGNKSYSLREIKAMSTDSSMTSEQRAMFEEVYNNVHGYARDLAMLDDGAVKSGKVEWEFSRDNDGNIDWQAIENSMRESNKNVDSNATIHANMEYILSSSEAKSSTGNRFQKAKAANKVYDEEVQGKINNDRYKSAKANAGK